MQTIDAISEILKREGVECLSCFPTTPVIEAAAIAGIRPIICRQERVGVGIADGYSRVTNGEKMGVFAMQYGPPKARTFWRRSLIARTNSCRWECPCPWRCERWRWKGWPTPNVWCTNGVRLRAAELWSRSLLATANRNTLAMTRKWGKL